MHTEQRQVGFRLLEQAAVTEFEILRSEVIAGPDGGEFGLRVELQFVRDADESLSSDESGGSRTNSGWTTSSTASRTRSAVTCASMPTMSVKVLYTSHDVATGGRNGHTRPEAASTSASRSRWSERAPAAGERLVDGPRDQP
jgi:hypothetical protein